MEKMTDGELAALLSTAVEQATEYNGEYSKDNEKYLNAYYANKTGDFRGEEGRSSVVSTDVFDVVESDMVSHSRTFLGQGEIVSFVSHTSNKKEEDEAQEKTDYVDWVVRGQPNSYQTNLAWLKDAEIQKTGVVKYYIDEQKEVDEKEYKGVSIEEVIEIQESLVGADVDRVKVEVSEQEETSEQTFDIKFRITRIKKKTAIVNVPPELFLITRNATSKDTAELVGDKIQRTRGELLADGYDKKLIDSLPALSQDIDEKSQLGSIRNQDQGGVDYTETINNWASQQVELKDLYVKVDYDKDGIAERRHILMSGNVILVNDYFNHVPYAMMSAIPMPHKAIGRSRAEVVYETQRQKTSLLRGMNDNIYATNNPQKVAHPDVDLDDLMTRRLGETIVRMDDDTNILPGQAVFPLAIPYTGDKNLQVLQYADQARAQTTGTLMASQGLDADALTKETATRFNGVKEEGQGKIEAIARNFAETGWRSLYEGVAWLVSRYQDTETEIKVIGKPLTVKPTSWKYSQSVESKVGLGSGNKEEQLEARQAFYAVQKQLHAEGSKLVDESKLYTNLEGMKIGAGLNRSEVLFNNPEEPAELLKRENELLNQTVLQLQEQNAQLQNPLADAELVKREGDVAIAQGKLELEVTKLQEQQRQFNEKLLQEKDSKDQDTAVALTKLELENDKDIEGALV